MKRTNAWRKRLCAAMTVCTAATMLMGAVPVSAAEGIDMSTDYPGIMVKAGENITFPLDFISTSADGADVELSAVTLPEKWSGYFKGDGSQITMVHVEPAAEGTSVTSDELADFILSVPAETAEGTYEVELKADAGMGNTDILTLEVTVAAIETGSSSFTSEYPEQQGKSGSSFSFDTTLVNNRATEQSYNLSAGAPEGWEVSFKPADESTQVSSLSVESGSSQGITISVVPPEKVEKGEYSIPISAVSAEETLKTELKVTITGTYSISMSTPDGRLSFDAYANEASSVTLSVTNTGNVDLENLNLTSSAPTDWEVTFSESTIDVLEAGATKEVTAYVTPCEDSITGDYATYLTISNDEVSADADFRVSVKTPTTWGIAAIGIIAVLIAVLAVIFKKYGRR